jgi:hypothetical protein
MKTNGFLGLKRNNRGQIAIEAVLLMTILLGGFIVLTKYANEKKILSKLVAGPIKNVATMTAHGTWKVDGCTAPGKSKQTIGKCHPNSIERSLSSKIIE